MAELIINALDTKNPRVECWVIVVRLMNIIILGAKNKNMGIPEIVRRRKSKVIFILGEILVK